MISDEKILQFKNAKKVYGKCESGFAAGILGAVDFSDSELPYRIDYEGETTWVKTISLEDPRPKIVFEDGAWYPAIFKDDTRHRVIRYTGKERKFISCSVLWELSDFSFIGDKLPSSLWGGK